MPQMSANNIKHNCTSWLISWLSSKYVASPPRLQYDSNDCTEASVDKIVGRHCFNAAHDFRSKVHSDTSNAQGYETASHPLLMSSLKSEGH